MAASVLLNNERTILQPICREDQTSADAYNERHWQRAETAGRSGILFFSPMTPSPAL